MNRLSNWVRPNILKLQPYSSAKDEYTGKDALFLDANESPFGTLNRYPDPRQRALKEVLAKQENISSKQLFVGNGSDEVIDLLIRIFCTPGKDKIGIFTPTYGMYSVSAAIHDIEVQSIPLDANFDILDLSFVPFLNDSDVKVVFFCSPNNPTGNDLNREKMLAFIREFNGIVCVDEAYIEFSDQASLVKEIDKFDNLVVAKTMSKARGLAAVRVGYACANEELISLLNKVKPPYNVSSLNQRAALETLEKKKNLLKNIETLRTERTQLIEALKTISFTKKIYPTSTNFILVEMTNADKIYEFLISQNIIVRNRSGQIANCLRITVGTKEENQQLLTALNQIKL